MRTNKEIILFRLAELMLEKEQNKLLLDDLYEDGIIGPFVRNIQIDSPFQELIFQSILSTNSMLDNTIVIYFTQEAYSHFVLGKFLYQDKKYQNIEFLFNLLTNNKLNYLKNAVEIYLIEDTKNKRFDRITWLIDQGGMSIDIVIKPIIESFLIIDNSQYPLNEENYNLLIRKNVTDIFNLLLNEKTENDYICIKKCIKECDNNYKVGLLKIISETVKSKFNLKSFAEVEAIANCIIFFNDNNEKLMYIDKIEEWMLNNNITNLQKIDLYTSCISVCRSLSNHKKTKYFSQKCLKIELEDFGEMHLFVANSYNTIGLICVTEGSYDEAILNFEKSLKIREELLQNSDGFITESVHNIALVHQYKQENEQAIKLYEKVLERRLKNEGIISLGTASVLTCLGSAILNEENDDELAIKYLLKGYDINEKILGYDNSINTHVRPYIARYYYKKNNKKIAKEYLTKNIKIIEKTLGNKTVDFALALWHLVTYYEYEERFYSAIKTAEKAIPVFFESLGKSHEFCNNLYQDLGDLYFKSNNTSKAIECYNNSITLKKEEFPNEDKYCFESLNSIGEVYLNDANYNNAIEYFNKSINCIKNDSDSKEQLAGVYYSLGICYNCKESLDLAIKFFKKSFSLIKGGNNSFQLADCLYKQNQKQKALKYYIISMKIRFKNLGLDDEATIEAANKAIELASQLNLMKLIPKWAVK
jgi:tetratricopeptide (TPR) repeat protein